MATSTKAAASALPRYLRLDDLTHDFNVNRVTIWRWVQTGTLPAPIRIGRTPYWTREVLEAHLAKRRGAA